MELRAEKESPHDKNEFLMKILAVTVLLIDLDQKEFLLTGLGFESKNLSH